MPPGHQPGKSTVQPQLKTNRLLRLQLAWMRERCVSSVWYYQNKVRHCTATCHEIKCTHFIFLFVLLDETLEYNECSEGCSHWSYLWYVSFIASPLELLLFNANIFIPNNVLYQAMSWWLKTGEESKKYLKDTVHDWRVVKKKLCGIVNSMIDWLKREMTVEQLGLYYTAGDGDREERL